MTALQDMIKDGFTDVLHGNSVTKASLCFAQISGFTDIATATLNACFNVGNAVGMVTGGILGDLFAKRFPESARPFVNQISMLVVAPLQLILYKGLPGALFGPCLVL